MWQKTKNVYHLFVAILAVILNRFPARKLIVIGVTGTDGKTTTTTLIYHILKTAGYRVSLISTLQAIIGEHSYNTGFHVTNPPALELQKFLRKAIDPKTKEKSYIVLEVSSHGIDQHRIWGIPFTVGVLTNVSHEHLDYHKNYENYVSTKAKLLLRAKTAIVNKDDRSYLLIQSILKQHPVITYGMDNADITPKIFVFTSQLIGEFNKYNCLAAIAACKKIGISDENIKKGLQTFTPPLGRGQVVYKGNFTIMIDFAHTPNAFEQILSAVRPQVKGRLIHVFGCASERDSSKRPFMGEVSSRYADIIILTAEDPRKESLEKINSEIKSGIQTHKTKRVTVIEVHNRKEAIHKAISLAEAGDLVLLTGKAHESSINYGQGEEPWNEYETVTQALALRTKT